MTEPTPCFRPECRKNAEGTNNGRPACLAHEDRVSVERRRNARREAGTDAV